MSCRIVLPDDAGNIPGVEKDAGGMTGYRSKGQTVKRENGKRKETGRRGKGPRRILGQINFYKQNLRICDRKCKI